jgi:hypothetical protein
MFDISDEATLDIFLKGPSRTPPKNLRPEGLEPPLKLLLAMLGSFVSK